MLKQFVKSLIFLSLIVVPAVLMAQPPTWSGGGSICDTCSSTPIDQQSILLASGGVLYAIHKIRANKKK